MFKVMCESSTTVAHHATKEEGFEISKDREAGTAELQEREEMKLGLETL